MYLSYGTFAWVCAGIAVVWFWHDSLRARDIANVAAMAACERIGLQFLDGTAAFTRLRLTRVGGQLRLRRTYVFDYTSQSIERRQGFAILVGTEVEYVGFAPEHTARPEPPSIGESGRETSLDSQQNARIIDAASNVYDLNERRTRRSLTPDSAAETTPKSDRRN
jgi:hypothetical protein